MQFQIFNQSFKFSDEKKNNKYYKHIVPHEVSGSSLQTAAISLSREHQ